MKRLIFLFSIISIVNLCFAQSDSVIIEKSKDKVIIGGQMYYVHIVKQGETLFSLSSTYEVSQKDIAKENPEIFLGLQVGQALKIPINKNDEESSERISKKDFVYHRVKKGQTLYSLSKKYNVSQEDIITCNPTVKYGINIDQIVKIPKSKDIVAEIQKVPVNEMLMDTIHVENEFVYHTVEKRETIYSLTRFYEISEDILLENNPDISEGLKIGQVLKIPNVTNLETETVLFHDETKRIDSVLYEKRSTHAYSDSLGFRDCFPRNSEQLEPYKVAVMLPLYLEKNDEEYYVDSSEVDDFGKKIYERVYYEAHYIYPNSIRFIEFYEGILLSVDSLKAKGLSVNLHVYDTEADTSRIMELLEYPELKQMDLIIGPIFNHEVKLVSEFSRTNGIKMISPLSDNLSLIDSNPYLYQIYPSFNAQIEEFSRYVSSFKDKNIVLVHNGDSLAYSKVQMVRDRIFSYISMDTAVNNIQFKEVVFKDSINVLDHALNSEMENVFVIPSIEEAFVTNVVTNLNTLKTFGKDIKVVGLSRWQRFKNVDPEYYFNLNLSLASPFFIDYHKQDVTDFLIKYRNTFRTEPSQMAIHGYDVGLYFFSALNDFGSDFSDCIYNYNIDLLQADYHFVKWYQNSGFENIGVSIIKYYDGYNIFKVGDYKEPENLVLETENGI